MSFSNNCKPEKMPGPIKGNPMTGLSERTSIEVDKVFDACIKQYANVETEVKVDHFPSGMCPPIKFISAASTSSTGEVRDLVVSEIPDSKGCARITCNVIIPINIVIVDSKGQQFVLESEVEIPRDIVMHIASDSIMPYDIVAEVNLIAPTGEYIPHKDGIFKINFCAAVIMKVIMKVQLLVPSYGYTYIPPCQEYTQDVCDGLFDLPIYPNDTVCY